MRDSSVKKIPAYEDPNLIKNYTNNNKIKPGIFFITGTSGAGKTTLVNNLKILIEKYGIKNIVIRDFDEIGVPEGADQKWRQESSSQWLKYAIDNYDRALTTIVCGQSVPGEIKESKYYTDSLKINYGFIHIKEATIIKRLKNRNWTNELIEANINWEKHLRSYVEAERRYLIVMGDEGSPELVAEKFFAWILKETNL